MTVEEAALLLDRHSIIAVVSALRKYRMAHDDLRKRVYSDGEVDAVALQDFWNACQEAETDVGVESPHV